MKFQNKNKIITIFIVSICLFFTITSLSAIINHFTKQRKESIKLMNNNNFPIFTVERADGNNEDKTLLPIPIPNLNPDKLSHLITINHQASLNTNGTDIKIPLYLKLSTKYDTFNTFSNPENYFNVVSKINNHDYDDTKRPQMILKDNGIGTINIQISIEQKETISNQNPKLELICDYELVDSQGKPITGGSQKITNTNKLIN